MIDTDISFQLILYKFPMQNRNGIKAPLNFVSIKFCTNQNEIRTPLKVALQMTFIRFKIRIVRKKISSEDCATQCQLPFPRDDDSQKEARKTMPTALHRDDESSNPGSKQEIVLRVE